MSLRVLVVDDDPAICRMLGLSLAFEGFDVSEASHGAEALDVIQRERPDVILLDLKMPVVNGLELARELRGDPATADIPIIVLTARASDAQVWSGWQCGVDSYLTKPFSFDALLAEMARVLSSVGVSA